MAETLLRKKKETNVCVFEKESRFGGRILDHWFAQAPDVAVGESSCENRFAFTKGNADGREKLFNNLFDKGLFLREHS